MQNRKLTIAIAALLFFGFLGRGELPESPELEELLFSVQYRSQKEVAKHADLYVNFLNEDRMNRLRALLSRVAANGPELTVNDFASASAALRLLGVVKAPGMVEAAIPFMQISDWAVGETAAEVMAATGSEAAVEHLEAAFQRNMKTWLSGDPWAVTKIWKSIRCFAINGTPKARAAYDRSTRQVAEAVKTGNAEDQKWEREHIANAWEDVEKEKRGKGLPDPSDARRIGPAKLRDQPKRDALGNEEPQSNAAARAATMGEADQSAPIPSGWALWGGVAAILAATAGWLFLRRRGDRRGSERGTD